jgi:hypothetical protein
MDDATAGCQTLPGHGLSIWQHLARPFARGEVGTRNARCNRRRRMVVPMKAVSLVVIALGGVLSLSASTRLSAAPDGDLAGVYACEGTLPSGGSYSGTVDIVRHADTYQVRWFVRPPPLQGRRNRPA